MRSLQLRIILFPFLLLGIAACSQQEEVTLHVVMGLAEEEWRIMREEVFPLFEQKYNCRIEAYQVEAADWEKKLKSMVAAGRVSVDVFSQDNMRLYPLVSGGLVEELTSHRETISSQIPHHMRAVGEFGGKLYFFPYRPNVQITYYNEEKFRTYGLEPPRTWDELLAVAKIFKEKEGVGRIGFKLWGDGPTTTQVYEMIISAGGDPFSFNDRGCIETFAFLKKLYPYLASDSKKAKWDTTTTYLANESFYLAQNWPFATNILLKDYEKKNIAAYSGWRGPLQEVHVIGGEVLGIPKGAVNRELALAFILFLESKEIQELLSSRLGWPPLRQDVHPEVEPWQAPFSEAMTHALACGMYRQNVAYWPEFDKFLNEAVGRIVMKGEDTVRVLNEYHRKMQTVIHAYSHSERTSQQ